eukprot:Pgem_evm1s1965
MAALRINLRQPNIVCLAGSLKKGSNNFKLLQCSGDILEKKGAKVTVIDMNDYAIPIYSEDVEKE